MGMLGSIKRGVRRADGGIFKCREGQPNWVRLRVNAWDQDTTETDLTAE